jgi:hypothetical protein
VGPAAFARNALQRQRTRRIHRSQRSPATGASSISEAHPIAQTRVSALQPLQKLREFGCTHLALERRDERGCGL